MAVHSYDKDTQREYESAAAFRAQLDREAERHAREMYRREEERNEANLSREEQLRIEREEQRRREQSANRVMSENLARGMRSGLKDDPYGREAYNTFIEFSALRNAGMVMGSLLANTAAEASYVSALEDARDAELSRKTNDTSIIEAAERQSERTLQDYITSVEESRAALAGASTAYHVEFEETRREAERVQATATRAYETIKTNADAAIRTADDTYTKSLSSIARDTEMAIKARDTVIATASMERDQEIRQIASGHANGAEVARLIDTAQTTRMTAEADAHKAYETTVETIRGGNHDAATVERMMESAAQTRDLAIETASKQYNSDVREIATTHLDAESAAAVHRAIATSEVAVVRANADYENRSAQLELERKHAADAHRTEIAVQTDRIADAERKRDTVVNHQNDVIRTSQIKLKEAIDGASQELTNAENKRNTYEQSREGIPTAALSLQRALNPVEGRSTSVTLETYSRGIEKVQIHIGAEMTMRFGTDDEKRIVSRIMDNIADATPQDMAKLRSISMQYAGDITAGTMMGAYTLDAATAAKLGTDSERKFITSILDKGEAATAEEKRQVEAIVKKYEPEMAHDFGTTGCRDAVASIENFRHFLEKENTTIAAQLQTKTSELHGIESRIAVAQVSIQKLDAIQTQLSTGKGADGKPLTEGQIKELKQQLGKVSKEAAAAAGEVAELTQRKNALKASINQMTAMQSRNAELIKGIGAQTERLKTNGKAVALQLIVCKNKDAKAMKKADFQGAKWGQGKGKAAVALLKNKDRDVKNGVDASNRKFNKSIDKLQREHLRKINKGDIFWEEMNRVTVKAMMNQRKFEKAVAITSYARNLASPMAAGFSKGFKLVGKQTRLTNLKENALHSNKTIGGWVDKSRAKQFERQQKKIEEAKKLKAENEKRKAAGLKPLLSKEEQRIKKIGDIINLPMTIRTKPKEFIRTQTTKLAKKATNKIGGAIGKTRLGKWANKTFSPALQALKRFQSRLKKLNPMNFINKVKEKIIGWLLSILSSFLGIVGEFLGYAAGVIGILLLIIIILLLILMLIMAAIAAILNFFQQMSSEHQSLVKNNPAFMLEQAVNYRDSEMEILEMFKSTSPDVWKEWNLIPSTDPFFLAMSYKLGDEVIETPNDTIYYLTPHNTSFLNWYINTRMPYEVTTGEHTRWVMDGSEYIIDVSGPNGDDKYNISSTTSADTLRMIYNLHIKQRTYDRAQIYYYTSDALASGDSYGNYTLKADATPVDYEISNAKDALAVTDAVYVNKQDTMQKFEVLAYLGVGEYQMAETSGNKPLMNLFWATHKPIYLSGNSANDTWYHKTKPNGDIDANVMWNGSSAPYPCNTANQITIVQHYETDEMVPPHPSPDMYCNGWEISRTSTGTQDVAYSIDGKKDLYYKYLFMTGSKLPGYTMKSEPTHVNSNALYNGYIYGNFPATIYLEHYYTNPYGVRYYWVYDSYRTQRLDSLTFASWAGINNRNHMKLTWDSTLQDYVFTDIESVPNGTVKTPFYTVYSFKEYTKTCGCKLVSDGTPKDNEISTTICTGHLDLKMAMVVSSLGGDASAEDTKVQESFLYDAARVTPVPPGQSKGNFFFTWDTDMGICGFGDVDVEPFDPATDLAEDSDIRQLAMGKAQIVDEKYELKNEDDDPSADAGEQSHTQSSGESNEFKRLRKSPRNTLLYGMSFGGRVFYVESYKSGLQQDLKYFEWWSGNSVSESATLLSIAIGTDGKPYIP